MAAITHADIGLILLRGICAQECVILHSPATQENVEVDGKWGLKMSASGWAYIHDISGAGSSPRWVKDLITQKAFKKGEAIFIQDATTKKISWQHDLLSSATVKYASLALPGADADERNILKVKVTQPAMAHNMQRLFWQPRDIQENNTWADQ